MAGFQPAATPAVETTAGADPQRAIARFRQRTHVVVAQPLVAVDRAEWRIAQAQQAGIGAGPDAALAIDQQCRNAVVRQAAQAGVFLDIGIRQPQQTVVDGANPQVAGGIPRQAGHAIVRQQRRRRHEALPRSPIHAAFGSDEQRTGRVLDDAEYRRIRQARGTCIQHRACTGEMHQSACGRRPHAAVAIQQQAIDHTAGQAIAGTEMSDPFAIDQIDTRILGRHPQPPLAIQQCVHDFFLCQPLLDRPGAPVAAAFHGHAATRRTDHHRTILGRAYRTHAVVLQRRRVAAIEDVKLEAVVARQSFPGTEPQITIRGLRNPVDLVVRQALARGPGLAEIRAQRLVLRMRERRQQDEVRQQHADADDMRDFSHRCPPHPHHDRPPQPTGMPASGPMKLR